MAEGELNLKVNLQVASNAKEIIRGVQDAAKQAQAGLSSGGQFGGELQAAATQARSLASTGAISPNDLRDVLNTIQRAAATTAEEQNPSFGRAMRKKGGFDPTALNVDEEYKSATEQAARAKRQAAIASQQAVLADAEAIHETVTLAQNQQALAAAVADQLAVDDDYLANTAIVAIAKAKEAAVVSDLLATDEDYIANTAIAAVNKAKENAAIEDLIATDVEYIAATAAAAASQQQKAAGVEAIHAADDDYIANTAIVAVARQKQAAGVAELTSTDDEYLAVTASISASRQREAAGVQELLTINDDYIANTAITAIAHQKQAASAAELTSTDDEYIAATARLAAANQVAAAAVEESLAADGKYIENTVRVSTARQLQSAKVEEQLAVEGTYASYTARIASARQVQAADVQEQLAGDVDYLVSTALVAVERQKQAADVSTLTSTDGEYIAATARVAANRAVEGAAVAELLITDTDYVGATQRASVARKLQEVAIEGGLSDDAVYREATMRVAVIREEQRANLQESLNADPAYTAATKRVAVARAEQAANLQTGLSADPAYREATFRAAIARQKQQADLQQSLAGEPAYRESTVALSRAREQMKAKVAEALATDDAYKTATVQATIAREQQKADVQSRLAADPAYAAATVQATSAREEQQAAIRAGLASDQRYITATAEAAIAREEQAARVKLAKAGQSTGLLLLPSTTPGATPGTPAKLTQQQHTDLLANAAAVDRARADTQAAANARAMIRVENGAIAAATDRRIAEAEAAAILKKRTKEEMRASIRAGEGGGTTVQRISGYLKGEAPEGQQTGPEMLAQKTITSAGYALAGMASAAVLFGTIQAVKEASKLQEIFAGLQGQMQAIGQADAFGQVKDGIKGIAAETGIAASEVAKFASRLIGVYNDPVRALQETESAMKLAAVAGVDLNTMMENLVPIAKRFGVSIEHIGDVAVGIHDKFGIAEQATIDFLGTVAPLAEEAGISIESMAVLGATAANNIGKSMGQIGEQMVKILPTIAENQDQIYAILQENPKTQGAIDPLIDALGRGDTGDAFKLLIKSYGDLTAAQQQNLVKASGSKREWGTLFALYGGGPKLLKDMKDAESGAGDSAGLLAKRFQQVSETITKAFERVRQSFQNAAEGLLSSGLGDALGLIGASLGAVLDVLNIVIGAFQTLNNVSKSIPGFSDTGFLVPLVEMAAAIFVVTKAWNVFNSVRAGGRGGTIQLVRDEEGVRFSIQRTAKATEEEAGALAADDAAKQKNAGSTGTLTAANEGLGGSKVENTVLTEAETASTLGLTEAEMAEITSASGATVAESELAVARGEASLAAAGETAATGAAGIASRFNSSTRMQKLFAGGRGFGGLNAAAAEGGAATGIAASPVAMVAIPAVATALVVKTYADQHEQVEKAADDLRLKLKKASKEQLESIARDYTGIMDRLEGAFFNEDMPNALAQTELNIQAGKRGAAAIGVLQEDKRRMDAFAASLSDARLGEINTLLNASDENKQFADAIGANIEGNVFEKGVGLIRNLGEKYLHTTLPTGIGRNEVKVDRENLKQILPQVKERAEKGEKGAKEMALRIQDIIDNDQNQTELRNLVDQAVAAGDTKTAEQIAGGLDQFLQSQGLYDPEGALQAGKIGRGQYLAQVKDVVSRLQRQGPSTSDPVKTAKETDAQLAKAQQVSDQIVKERIDQAKRVAAITNERPKAGAYAADLLALPKFSMPEQVNQIPTLIQDQWDMFQEQLSHISDPQKRYEAALKGIDVDKPTQILQVYKNLKDSPLARLVDTLKADGQSQDDFFNEISKIRVETGKSIQTIIYEYAAKKYQGKTDSPDYTKLLNDLGNISQADWDTANQIITHLGSPKDMLLQLLADQKSKADNAAADAVAIGGGNDPMAAAQNQLDKANIELAKQRALKAAGSTDPNIDASIQEAANNVAKAQQGVATVEHQTAAALDQWAVVFANGDPVKETNAELANAIRQSNRILEEAGGNVNNANYINSLQEQARIRQKQVDNQHDITKAQMDLAAFDRNQDPEAAAADARRAGEYALSIAKSDKDRLAAQLQIKQADRQTVEAVQARMKADRDLVSFDTNEDPIAAAQTAINEANIAIAEAQSKGGGEQSKAALGLKQAFRQMRDAQEAFLEAQAQSAITMATINQDPVEAARLKIVEAERKLNAARAAGKGAAELQQLTDGLAQARSDAVDTAVSEDTDMIDYLQQMGEITRGQAIERLKVDRDKYAVNSKKWRDLQLKIQSLQQGAKADTQFNLPANITLPTLYEARRLNQSRQMGIGYMDNRNIALTFNVDGAQDPALVSTQIMNALQGAMGGGQMYTPGVAVGAFN